MKNTFNPTNYYPQSTSNLIPNSFTPKKNLLLTLFCSLFLSLSSGNPIHAATIDLIDYGINLDGASTFPTMGDALLGTVDVSSFDQNAGLGTLRVFVSGAGNHFVGAFFDHEIDETINTFFNESGHTVGVPETGQSWETEQFII